MIELSPELSPGFGIQGPVTQSLATNRINDEGLDGLELLC